MSRISAKVRQRKRQTWLDLQASGIGEVPNGLAQFLAQPRHDYVIPENVSRKLELAGQRESLRICRDD